MCFESTTISPVVRNELRILNVKRSRGSLKCWPQYVDLIPESFDGHIPSQVGTHAAGRNAVPIQDSYVV